MFRIFNIFSSMQEVPLRAFPAISAVLSGSAYVWLILYESYSMSTVLIDQPDLVSGYVDYAKSDSEVSLDDFRWWNSTEFNFVNRHYIMTNKLTLISKFVSFSHAEKHSFVTSIFSRKIKFQNPP